MVSLCMVALAAKILRLVEHPCTRKGGSAAATPASDVIEQVHVVRSQKSVTIATESPIQAMKQFSCT